MIILLGISSNISNFKLDASADSLILENDKDLEKYRNVIEDYGTKDFIIMTVTPYKGNVFDDQNLEIIRELREGTLISRQY